MNSTFLYRGRAGLALATLGLLPFPGLAQTTDQPAHNTSDDAVVLSTFQVSTESDVGYRAANSVSATRVNTPIKDLPFSVSAFTQQFINDIGARDLFDVVQFAPGVTSAGREFNAGNALFAIRGFNQTPQRNGFSGVSEPYVDTTSLERIEVVKGPASVLYGQVSPGGTVNYITKKPTAKRYAAVTGRVGTHEYWRTSLDANQPLIGKSLLFRFNGSWENALEDINPSRSQTTVLAPSTLWRITDRLSVVLDYQYFSRRESPPAYFKPNMQVPGLSNATGTNLVDPGFLGYWPGLARDFNYAGLADYRHTTNEFVNAEITTKIGDHWTVRGNANWGKSRSDHKATGVAVITVTPPAGVSALDFANAIFANPEVAYTAASANLSRRQRYQQAAGENKSFQVEGAATYKFPWGTLKPLAGVYSSSVLGNGRLRERTTGVPVWNFLVPSTIDRGGDFDESALAPGAAGSNQRTKTHDRAAYGIMNAALLRDRLMLIGGARYNKVDSKTMNRLTGVSQPTFRESRATPQFGAGFKVLPDVMTYASYSQSFVLVGAFLTQNGLPTGPAKPTTSEGYEAGIKTDLLHGRISSTVSVFTIDQADRIVAYNVIAPDGSILSNSLQGTVDRSRGYEVELTYSPFDNVQLYASAAFTDIFVKSVPPGAEPILGTRPEATVRHLYNLWARYTIKTGAARGAWIGGGFNYTGEKYQRVTNPRLVLPAETLWNAALGYDFALGRTRLSTTVNWQNIMDEEYFPANQQRGLPSRLVLSVTARY